MGPDGKCSVDILSRDKLEFRNEFEVAEQKALKDGTLQLEPPLHCTPRGRNLNRSHSSASSPRTRSPQAKGGNTNQFSPSPGRYWRNVHDGNVVLKRYRREPQSALLKAVRGNAKLEIVKKLLESGCLPDRQDEKLNSSLHVASHFGNANTCRMLLNANATPSAKNHLLRTPLHFAARSGHPRVLKMLLDSKANINAEDQYGQTPLSVACDTMVVKFLKDRGGKVNHEKEQQLLAQLDASGNGRDPREMSAPNSPNRSRSPSPNTGARNRSASPET